MQSARHPLQNWGATLRCLGMCLGVYYPFYRKWANEGLTDHTGMYITNTVQWIKRQQNPASIYHSVAKGFPHSWQIGCSGTFSLQLLVNHSATYIKRASECTHHDQERIPSQGKLHSTPSSQVFTAYVGSVRPWFALHPQDQLSSSVIRNCIQPWRSPRTGWSPDGLCHRRTQCSRSSQWSCSWWRSQQRSRAASARSEWRTAPVPRRPRFRREHCSWPCSSHQSPHLSPF